MSTDLVHSDLTSDSQQKILKLFDELKTLMPFLINLTPEDRRSLPRMGPKSRAFVDQGLVTAEQNPGILPRNFDLEEYRHHIEQLRLLEPLVLMSEQLNSLLEDTFTGIGSDCYSHTLVVYQTAKLAGKGSGLDPHLDSLAKRFARRTPGQSDAPSTEK